MQTLFHVTPVSNVKSIMREGLVPKIGLLSEGVENEERVYLFPTYEDCETALGQWLGAEYDDLLPPDERVVSLRVELPDDFPLVETCEYERVSYQKICPKHLYFFKDEG